MSTPNPNQDQPSNQPSEKKKKFNPRIIFLILITMVVIGYLIALYHTPGVEENIASNSSNMTRTPTNTSASENISIPILKNLIAINFTLTNSSQKNELIITKNGEIYIQIFGYFNQFPNTYPATLDNNLFIIYMVLMIYNGSSAKNIILPVFSSVSYEGQRYFIYQAEGNLLQLQQLVSVLRHDEFIGIVFYTNSSEIQGYTIW